MADERGLHETIVMPDYKNGSIVNLMSSILRSYGASSQYNPLRFLSADELRQYRNVVLIVIDGFGNEFLSVHGGKSIFAEYNRGAMTAVFPATTASGITTFLTGVAPQQHAITGWFMYLKEMGIVTKILPYVTRSEDILLKSEFRNFYHEKSLFQRIEIDSHYVIHSHHIDSRYTHATTMNANKVAYHTLTDMVQKMREVITSSHKKKFICAYWPDLDAYSHSYGTESVETLQHFETLNAHVTSFIESIKKTNTLVLITSDHGLVDADESRIIRLREHQDLAQTLVLPLCGEPRAAYCYVHPEGASVFEKYVEEQLSAYCTLHKARALIEKNYFGLFEPNPSLYDRIGDYVLIMKKNYVLKDTVVGEKEYSLKAYHGGMSREEMYVPLVVIDCERA